MALLTGAITFLSLAAAPAGAQTWTNTLAGASLRPNDGQFTTLTVNATPGTRAALQSDKTTATSIDKAVTDTYRPVTPFGDVSDADLDVTDTLTAKLTFSTYVLQTRSVSDTYTPRITEPRPNLTGTNTTARTVTDSYRAVLTEAATVVVQKTGTDTYRAVVTEAYSALDKSNAKTGSDTFVPVLTFSRSVNKVTSASDFPRADVVIPKIALASSVARAGEVDQIDILVRPVSTISISLV